MVWIADGYDEIPGQTAPNLYDANHLGNDPGRVKLIIGCRSQRVQALVEADSFVPHNQTGAPELVTLSHPPCRAVYPAANPGLY